MKVDFNIVELDSNEDIIPSGDSFLYRYGDIAFYGKYAYTKKQLLEIIKKLKEYNKAEYYRNKIKYLFLNTMPSYTPHNEVLEAACKAAEYGHLEIVKYIFQHYEFDYSEMLDILKTTKKKKIKKYIKKKIEKLRG